MKQIFINLPVADAERSMRFYLQLGFRNNQLFTDEHQRCMVWSEHIFVMLIAEEQFRKWNGKSLPERKFSSANFTLPVETIERMNEMVEAGLKAGGTEPEAKRDEGVLQLRRLEDPDGHVWGILYLDVEKFGTQKMFKRKEICRL